MRFFRMKALWLAALLVPVLFGCADTYITSPDTGIDAGITNTPAIGNAENAFTFGVDARSFSYHQQFALSFTADSLVVAIAVAGHKSGSGQVALLNHDGHTFYTARLNGNLALGEVTLTGVRPAQVLVSLTDFTGQCNIAVATRN